MARLVSMRDNVGVVDEMEGNLKAWWTDNDEETDLTLVIQDIDDEGITVSLNLSYAEAKQLVRVIQQKVNVPVLF